MNNLATKRVQRGLQSESLLKELQLEIVRRTSGIELSEGLDVDSPVEEDGSSSLLCENEPQFNKWAAILLSLQEPAPAEPDQDLVRPAYEQYGTHSVDIAGISNACNLRTAA